MGSGAEAEAGAATAALRAGRVEGVGIERAWCGWGGLAPTDCPPVAKAASTCRAPHVSREWLRPAACR
jgi:hypothetical protein